MVAVTNLFINFECCAIFALSLCLPCHANEAIIFHPFDIIAPNVSLNDLGVTKIEVIETGKSWDLLTKSQTIRDSAEINNIIEAFRNIHIKSDDVRKKQMPERRSFSKKAVVRFFSNDFMRQLEIEQSIDDQWWQFRYFQEGGLFNSSVDYGIDEGGIFFQQLTKIRGNIQYHFNLYPVVIMISLLIAICMLVFLFFKRKLIKNANLSIVS